MSMLFPCLIHQLGSDGWVKKTIDHTCFHSAPPLGNTLHLKWIANAVCGNSSALYLFPCCSDRGPDRNKALEGEKENVDFPVLNFVQGQPRAGSVPRPKILKGLPHPSVLTVTVCVSDYGLSWSNSRCFTKNHKFSLYLYSKQPNVLKFT